MHATHVGYLWLVPFFPLLGAVLIGFFGLSLQKRFGKRPVALLACSTVLASFVVSVYAFVQLLGTEPR